MERAQLLPPMGGGRPPGPARLAYLSLKQIRKRPRSLAAQSFSSTVTTVGLARLARMPSGWARLATATANGMARASRQRQLAQGVDRTQTVTIAQTGAIRAVCPVSTCCMGRSGRTGVWGIGAARGQGDGLPVGQGVRCGNGGGSAGSFAALTMDYRTIATAMADEAVGQRLRRVAGWAAVAVSATYAAGWLAGRALHRLNDQLATAYVALTVDGPGLVEDSGHGALLATVDEAQARLCAAAAAWQRDAEIVTRARLRAAGLKAHAAEVARQAAQDRRSRRYRLAGLAVVELRTIARKRLGSAARLGDRRIAQATRGALLTALC